MTLEEIIETHVKHYRSQQKEGINAKFIVFGLFIIGLFYAHYHLTYYYDIGKLGNDLRRDQILPVIVFTGIFFTIILFLTRPIKFVYPPKLKAAKKAYKKDIYTLMISGNPEIIEYQPNQKINPREFYASGIFHTPYEDYKGDDWLLASFGHHTIIMCELNTFRLFRQIFKGLFVKCTGAKKGIEHPMVFNGHNLPENGRKYFSQETLSMIETYCKKHETDIHISTVVNNIYIAIGRNRNLFERSDLKAIKNLTEDIEIFRSNLHIVKHIIRDLEK